MRVMLYTICWDEADMLPFFFRHYDDFVDRYFIYDDGSTDGSLDILAAHPKVELRRFERSRPDSFVQSHMDLQNTAWRESADEADWIIITAIDEHLLAFRRDTGAYLEDCAARGVTLVPAIGFQMLADGLPPPDRRLCEAITTGAPWPTMNKLSIFDPRRVTPNFTEGRHKCNPVGELVYPETQELLLLHYKYIGFERVLLRHAAEHKGLGPKDIEKNWGRQYSWPRDRLREEWDGFAKIAVDIAAPGFSPTGG